MHFANFAHSHFLASDPDNLTFEQRFLYRRYLRQARQKHQDLDAVPIPLARNS